MHFLTNTQNKCEIFILIPFNNNQFDLAHLVEHLVVMNTKGFLNNIMELGIIFDAMTFNDRITFSLSCDAQWTELALLNILNAKHTKQKQRHTLVMMSWHFMICLCKICLY